MWYPEEPDACKQIQRFTVYSTDGVKLGTVGEVTINPPSSPIGHRFYFHLEPTLLRRLHGAREVFIAARTIAVVDWNARQVVLTVPEERLTDDHWLTPPVATRTSDA